jgi:FMN-dependent NADH-azoreductase
MLLDIQSSHRGESSNPIALTNAFIPASQRIATFIVVDTLNAWNKSRPEFDAEAIEANRCRQCVKLGPAAITVESVQES